VTQPTPSAPDAKSASWGEIDGYLQQVLADYINTRPDPNDERFDPTSESYEPYLTYSDALLTWSAGLDGLTQQSANARAQALGSVVLADGTQIPIGDLPPGYAEEFDRANRNAYQSTMNQFLLAQDQLQSAKKQAGFENQMSRLSAAGSRDQLSLRKAEDELGRYISGLQESRNRADLINATKSAATPYATQGGKRSFSAADFGGALGALAGQAGLDPSAASISYPTTINFDPAGDMAGYDSALGVNGQLPGFPALESLAMGIPGAPDLGGGPNLTGPEAPAGLASLIASLTGNQDYSQIPIDTAAGPWADQVSSVSSKILDKIMPGWMGGNEQPAPTGADALAMARGAGNASPEQRKQALATARAGEGGGQLDALGGILQSLASGAYNGVRSAPAYLPQNVPNLLSLVR